MPGPVLVAVDDDGECLSALERELSDRYSRDYRIICTPSPEDALSTLERSGAGRRGGGARARGSVAPRDHRQRAVRPGPAPPPAREARAADHLGWLGRPRHRRGDLRLDGPRADRLLRAPALGVTGRDLPPDHLELPARVGARPPRRSAHDPRGRRRLVRAGVRAEGAARPLRDSALVLPCRLGPRDARCLRVPEVARSSRS